MKTHTAVALALLSMSVLAGLAAVPVQAVTPDCTTVPSQEIPGSQQSPEEVLNGQDSETWHLDVSSGAANPTVRVQLESNFDELKFEIFEQNGTCASSDDVVTPVCQDEVTLDTDGLTMPPRSQDCELDAPDSGTTTFYFVLENPQQDNLEFTIWEL